MANSRLKKDLMDLMINIYNSWDSMEDGKIDRIQLFKNTKNIYNDKNKVLKVCCGVIEEDLKTIIIYNSKTKEYCVSVKNDSGLVYVFSNLTKGITLLKDGEIIQENLLFQQVERENKKILLNIEDNYFLKNKIKKDFEGISVFDLNSEYKENGLSALVNNEDSFDDLDKGKKEPFILKLKSKEITDNLVLREEELEAIESVLSFSQKITKLTGLSIKNNKNKGYAEEDKIVMNIDFKNKENLFEKISFTLMLTSECFYSTMEDVLIIESFFKLNNLSEVSSPLLLIRENVFFNDNIKHNGLSDNSIEILEKYNKVINDNILVCVSENNNKNIVAVNMLGYSYSLVKGNDILSSDFFLDKKQIDHLEEVVSIPVDYVIGGNLYFRRNLSVVFNIDMKKVKTKKVDLEEIIINNESFIIIKSLDLNSDNAILSLRHKFIVDNINDLLLNYLSNERLHYQGNGSVEDGFLEAIFELKNEYVNEVGAIGGLKKSWSRSRKIKRYIKFAQELKLKILKLK